MKKKYIPLECIEIDDMPAPVLLSVSFDPTKTGDQTITPDGDEPAPGSFTGRSGWFDEDEE